MQFARVVLVAMLAGQAVANEPRPNLAETPSPITAAPVSPPLSPALSLDEATGLAVKAQPQLSAQSAQIKETRANAIAAGELPDPRLSLGVMSVPVDSFSLSREDMTQAVLGVSQMIPGGDKLRLEREALLRQAESSEAALEATRRGVARDAGLAWLELWYADAAQKLVQQLEREYERQVEWAQAALAANALSQEEALALRVMREYIGDRNDDFARQQARSRASLARWIGEAAYRPLPADDAVSLPLPSSYPLTESGMEAGVAAADGKTERTALQDHPELEMLRRQEAVAHTEADLARQAYKPDWSVDLSYGVRGGNRSDLATAVVSLELPLFPEKRQDRRLAGKLAAIERAQHQLQDRHRQLLAEMEAALIERDAAERRMKHFKTVLIPLAAQRVESALARYGAGKGGFASVIEARREELEARMKLLDQQLAAARATIAIRYFTRQER